LLKILVFLNSIAYLYKKKGDIMKTETALTPFPALRVKVDNLLAQQRITEKDIEDLNDLERNYLAEIATQKLQQLKGKERDNFINKIEPIMPAHAKNRVWEYNHYVITSAISKIMREHGYMPSKSDIADETGLSRQTVAKHLIEYKTQPEYKAEIEQFKYMTPKLLANVFKLASNGDTKAARLYFEMVGAINKQQSNTVVSKQNNYIQINNTILSQENLRHLSAEQLNQIENIITNSASM
jgi:predicted transcriptional regulator